jgi:hypothetical protein
MAMTDEAAKAIVRKLRDKKIAASESYSERIAELTREYEDDQQEDTGAMLRRQTERYEAAVEEAEALSILLGKV